MGVKLPKFGFEFGSTILEVLHNQLESCNQLLEYEPDSKWTLLTAALIMRSIDRFSFHKQTLEFLKKLEDVDKLRKGYYKDLASRWSIEVKLKEWIESGDYEKGKIDLKGLDLTTLYYSQYFMHISNEVDLRDNSLRNKVESSGDCHVIL